MKSIIRREREGRESLQQLWNFFAFLDFLDHLESKKGVEKLQLPTVGRSGRSLGLEEHQQTNEGKKTVRRKQEVRAET